MTIVEELLNDKSHWDARKNDNLRALVPSPLILSTAGEPENPAQLVHQSIMAGWVLRHTFADIEQYTATGGQM